MAALISHSRDYFERRGRDALQAPLNTSSGQPIWTQQQQQYAMQMRHRAVELGLQPGAASASGSGDWGRGMGRGGGSARGGRGSQQPAAQSGARYAGRLAEAMAKQAPNVAALQASAELAHTERVMHRLAQQAAAATGMPPASSLAPPSRTPAAYQAATPSAVLGQPPRMPSAAQLMAMMRGVTYSEEEKERSAQRTSLQLAAAAYMHRGEVAGEIVKGKPDVSTRGGEMATSSSRVLPNDAAGKEALCDVKKAAEPSPLGHAVASTRTTSAAPVKAVGTAKGNAAGRGRGARARPVASSPADHGAGGDASTSSQSGDAAALAEVRRKQAAGGTLTEPERWLLRSERFAKKPEAKSKKTVVLKGSKPTVPVGSASIPSTPAAQEATPMAPKDRPPEDFQVKSFEEIMAEKRKRKAEAAAN
eukprot:gene12153-14358_t